VRQAAEGGEDEAEEEEPGSEDEEDLQGALERGDEFEESDKQDAKTHANHIREIMETYYRVDFDAWVACQTADNTATNLLAADEMGVPHVGCLGHLLNLEVNKWQKTDKKFNEAVEKIHRTMLKIKSSNLTSTQLRGLTSLVPKIHNATRWSSKYEMMKRWVRIRDELTQLSEAGAGIGMETSVPFKERVEGLLAALEEVDQVTKDLQTHALSHYDGRTLLDNLIEPRKSGAIPGLELGDGCIGSDCRQIRVSTDFLSGAVKIRDEEYGDMSIEERTACTHLLEEQVEGGEAPVEPPPGSLQARLKAAKRRKMEKRGEKMCKSTDFILGSAAEVERLWSVAKLVLSDKRHRSCPVTVEAVLFLRSNRRLWGQDTVKKAMSAEMSSKADEKVALEDSLQEGQGGNVETVEVVEDVEDVEGESQED